MRNWAGVEASFTESVGSGNAVDAGSGRTGAA